MNKLSMNIRTLRKADGLTMVQLARRLKATQKAVTSYEPKQRTPTLEKLQKLVDIFGVTLDQLIGRKEVTITGSQPHVHGNSRAAKVQELYDKLPPLGQRAILKQIRALVASNQR
jgi:transcriptional regulator with XRE-family HTH domain